MVENSQIESGIAESRKRTLPPSVIISASDSETSVNFAFS